MVSESASPSTCGYASGCLTRMARHLPLLRVLDGAARRSAAMAGPGVVPLDDARRSPHVGAPDRPVRGWHLAPRPVGAHGPDGHAEVGGHVGARPPLGRGIRRVHNADGTPRSDFFEIYALT